MRGKKNRENDPLAKRKRYRKHLIVIESIVILLCIWKILRVTSSIPFKMEKEVASVSYLENDRVMIAISLSYLVYGCENCNDLSGTVNEILENNQMGIVIENDGIKREDKADPASALIDSSEFIRNYVGDYRFLTALKDTKSGFYGAAFCDDEKKCIWISYSGTVTFNDCIACAKLVLVPGLSTQEKLAFDLMNDVLESDEVQKQSYGVMLTGHSLGGTLASIVSRMSGCFAVTINGADGLAIDKMNDILGETPSEYYISNYMTSPGNKLSFKNLVQRLMFLGSYKAVDHHVYAENGYTTDTHCAFSFIKFLDDKFKDPILP